MRCKMHTPRQIPYNKFMQQVTGKLLMKENSKSKDTKLNLIIINKYEFWKQMNHLDLASCWSMASFQKHLMLFSSSSLELLSFQLPCP